MNHISLKARRTRFSKAGNCRNFLMSSRARRDALAERLDKTWGELRRHEHVIIERDWEKMLRLAAELDARRRQLDVANKHGDSC